MAQFDFYRLRSGQLVMDLQTDLLGIEASRVAAPLREAGRYTAFPGLTPVIHLNGTAWIVRVQELAAVPGSELRARVGTLEEHRDALETGFGYSDRRNLTDLRGHIVPRLRVRAEPVTFSQ